MKGLARDRPDYAVRAALSILSEDNEYARKVPSIILMADSKNADAHLIDALHRQKKTMLRWSICRTLRRVPAAETHADKLISSKNEHDRLAACDIAGWLLTERFNEQLKNISATDLSWDVRRAAHRAIQRLSRHRSAHEIHHAWAKHDNARRWTLLDALLSSSIRGCWIIPRIRFLWIGFSAATTFSCGSTARSKLKPRRKTSRTK
jgi:hypothetical protein